MRTRESGSSARVEAAGEAESKREGFRLFFFLLNAGAACYNLIMNDRDFSTALKLYGDRIGNMILHLDVEWIDIEIQIDQMRDFCRENAPDKMPLFEMLYVSRFRRLWEAWGYHWEVEGLPEQDSLYWLDV